MTEFCAGRAETLCEQWKALDNYLLVKYLDGNIKHQNDAGEFLDNGSGKNIPKSPMHPEFPEYWLRAIVNAKGDAIKRVSPK